MGHITKLGMLILALVFLWIGKESYIQFARADENTDLHRVLAFSTLTYWVLTMYCFSKLL